MKHFSIKEILGLAWQRLKDNFWFLIGLMILAYIAGLLSRVAIIGLLVTIFIKFVLTGVFLRLSRDQKVKFDNLFHNLGAKLFLHFLLVSIIVGVFSAIGFVLLIVPGIIVATGTAFAVYIIMDQKEEDMKNDSFWLAIKKSWHMTKGLRGKMLVFGLAIIGINILGALAIGLGLLVTIPWSALAIAELYNKFKAHHGNAEAPASSTA